MATELLSIIPVLSAGAKSSHPASKYKYGVACEDLPLGQDKFWPEAHCQQSLSRPKRGL